MNTRFSAAVPGIFVVVAVASAMGCSSPAEDDEGGAAALSGDIAKITVTCKDGTSQDATQAQVASGDVCVQDKESADLFDPSSCLGDPLDSTALIALMQRLGGTGKSEAKLADYKLSFRTRACNATTGCAPWTVQTGGTLAGYPWEVDAGGAVNLVADATGAITVQWQTSSVHKGHEYYEDRVMFVCKPQDAACKVGPEPRLNPLYISAPAPFPSAKIDLASSIITDHCARFVMSGTGSTPTGQAVAVVKFPRK